MQSYVYSDFISTLNNARRQHFQFILVKNNNKILETLRIFLELNVITSFTIIDDKNIKVYLKYLHRRCVFKDLKLISLPSKRIFVNLVTLYKLKENSNTCFFIISTNQGLKTDFECIFDRLSGEVLLKVNL
jgi:ribosomal protein S8